MSCCVLHGGAFQGMCTIDMLRTTSHGYVHRNLKVALELVDVVADSRYRLYEGFLHSDGRRLAEYLSAVRQAVLFGLEGGGSDPLKVLVS